MPSISRQFILFVTLPFVFTAHAAQEGESEMKKELATPSVVKGFTENQSRKFDIGNHKNINRKLNELEGNQSSNRYGIGYEMRHGGHPGNQNGGHRRGR